MKPLSYEETMMLPEADAVQRHMLNRSDTFYKWWLYTMILVAVGNVIANIVSFDFYDLILYSSVIMIMVILWYLRREGTTDQLY